MLKFELARIYVEASKLGCNAGGHNLVVSFSIIYKRVLLVVAGALVYFVLVGSLLAPILLLQAPCNCFNLFLLARLIIERVLLVLQVLLDQFHIGDLFATRAEVHLKANRLLHHGFLSNSGVVVIVVSRETSISAFASKGANLVWVPIIK